MKTKFLSGLVVGAVVLFFTGSAALAIGVGNTEVTVTTSLDETYDDNVTFVKNNRKTDYITKLGLGLEWALQARMADVKLSGGLTQNVFARNSDFNNLAENLGVTATKEFSKYDRITLTDAFDHAEEPTSFADAFGSTSGRYSYKRNDLSLDYTRDISEKLGLGLKYLNGINAYSREDLADSYLNRGEISLGYSVSSTTRYSVLYAISRRDFDPGSHVIGQSAGLSLRQFITKQLYYDVGGGVDVVTTTDTTHARPVFNLAFTDDVDKKTSTKLSFAKTYNANAYSSTPFNRWQVTASIIRSLLERLGVNSSIFYGDGRYTTSGIHDKFSGANVGFTYDIKSNIQANLSYAYSQTSSNESTREYTKNTVTAGCAVKF